MEWLNEVLTSLTAGIDVSNPHMLGIIFLLGAVSEIGFPLFFAIETFLFFISYDYGPLSSPALLMVSMMVAGRLVGSILLYTITRVVGSRFLDWLGRRSDWILKAVEKFTEKINNQPITAVTLVRLTPGMLQVPSITSGAIRLSPLKFAVGVACSSLIYDGILLFLGYTAQFALPHLNAGPKTYLIVGFIVLIGLIWITLFLSFRRGLRGQ